MYQYIRPYIGADDFIEPLYHSVAIMLFEQLDKEEKINPAAILSRFTDAEEQKEGAGKAVSGTVNMEVPRDP